MLILCLFALSFDLVWGYAGIMSFGQAVFFGSAGYGVALIARDLGITSIVFVLPVGVLIGPVVPGLNDAEILRILEAAVRAGARSASWVLLRLPKPVDELFDAWLAQHYPERRERVLGRIREVRAGRLSDAKFHRRQRGQGEYAEQIAQLFAVSARKHGLDGPLPPLSTASFRRPARAGEQLRLL